MDEDKDPFDEYAVVKNDEEQYSVWPSERPVPAGWQEVGIRGTRSHCLDRIDGLWTDMRPRSLREAMDRDTEEARA